MNVARWSYKLSDILPHSFLFRWKCNSRAVRKISSNYYGCYKPFLFLMSLRIENPEERELQQQRLISSSLQGLRFLAKHLPPANHEWLWTALEPLFASQVFWKYPSHTSAQIRQVYSHPKAV